MTRARADALLLLIASIWGTAFVAQKDGSTHLGFFAFVAARFLTAAVVLAPACLWEARRSRHRLARGDLAGAIAIALCLCTGSWLQQAAVATIPAGHAGFLTAAYIALVPLIAWLATGRAPRPLVIGACAVALAGAWLMSSTQAGGVWSRGDLAIAAADLVWAGHILLVGHYRGLNARPLFLSFFQCAVTALASLPLALAWQRPDAAALAAALPAIGYAGIVSSGLAYTLQIVAQRHTPPSEAALIMSLESVFAALAGAWLLHESMAPRAVAGAALILLGVVFVEAGPILAGRRTASLANDAPAGPRAAR